MDAKEILGQVKVLFNSLMAGTPPVPAAAPAAAPATTGQNEYELKIGGKVTIDNLAVGGTVMIDGSPALPGTIELADGTELTVGDNGAITAIVPAGSNPDQGGNGTDMGAKFSAFESLTNEKFASYEQKFAAYEQRFAQYETKLAEANKVIGKLLELSTLIVEAPGAKADPAANKGAFKEQKVEPSGNTFLDNLSKSLF